MLAFDTRIDFAAELEISRTTVQNFFAGKPIGRENFHKICRRLGLPWQEIAQLPQDPMGDRSPASSCNNSELVETLRRQQNARIQHQCGTVRVLDMCCPTDLNQIYTDVKVLEQVSARQRKEVEQLWRACTSWGSDRPNLNQLAEEGLLGRQAVERYSKLMVLGKPGAGKTTFLKYIALECTNGQLYPQSIPVFVSLRDFAEAESQPSLLSYLSWQLATDGIVEPKFLQGLLQEGKFLLLLDGLDEVRELDSKRTCLAIDRFAARYPKNRYIITCRLAARDFTFEQFTEVEIADFDWQQIETFARRWFCCDRADKAKVFIEKLRANHSIRELSSNPLLLTLLCLAFEETRDFPQQRSQLYKEGLEVLLETWDANRYIEREQVHQELSLPYKEELLAQIALASLQQGRYLFPQPELEDYISAYIARLQGDNDQGGGHLDGKAVLKSIEAQHGLLVERAKGVYSFSHLTFHEYFAARAIAGSFESVSLLQGEGGANQSWREALLLAGEMVPCGDSLVLQLKQQIDSFAASHSCLQATLACIADQTQGKASDYEPATLRAFYLDLFCSLAIELDLGSILTSLFKFDPAWVSQLDFDRHVTYSLVTALNIDRHLTLNLDLAIGFGFDLAYALDTRIIFDPNLNAAFGGQVFDHPQLREALDNLTAQLPNPSSKEAELWQWWQECGLPWAQQLKAIEDEYCARGDWWRLSRDAAVVLRQYHEMNRLLVEFLRSRNCHLSSQICREIEGSLLLPIALGESSPHCCPISNCY